MSKKLRVTENLGVFMISVVTNFVDKILVCFERVEFVILFCFACEKSYL